MGTDEGLEKIRIDKWLWYARVVKTRTLAAKLVSGGHVRVNREKTTSASAKVKRGDVLTIAAHERIRVLEIREVGKRRGPAAEAATLFNDLSPPPPKKSEPATDGTEASVQRTKRPDKRDRRQAAAMKRSFGE